MRDTFGTCPLLPVLRQLRLPPDTCFLRPLTGSPLHQATPVADHLGSTLSPTSTILLIPTLTHTPIHTHHHSTWSFIRLQPTVWYVVFLCTVSSVSSVDHALTLRPGFPFQMPPPGMMISGAGDGISSYPTTPSTDAPPVSITGEASSSRKNSGNSQPEINQLVRTYPN